ncbi:MAG TPA: methyltransferase domain-containing protein [Patescibacteria group bacterium]|nr:methyltransferase domain-containing protein [Patescibacteria group bacterium]
MIYDYNKISNIYDDVREADLETVRFIIERTQINDKSRILEIGCGTANYLNLIYQLTQAEVWGLDKSQGMLNKAKVKCKSAVLIEDDAAALSRIPDSSFDLVYMVDVIHHINDIEPMFQNIRRVLRVNGKIIVFSDSHEHIRSRLTTKYFPETLEPELKRYQDTPEIVQCLSKQGFTQIQSGILEVGEDSSFGPKLIETASKKGYSMFGLISETAIMEGIERIKRDMLQQPIVYHQKAPYIIAVK